MSFYLFKRKSCSLYLSTNYRFSILVQNWFQTFIQQKSTGVQNKGIVSRQKKHCVINLNLGKILIFTQRVEQRDFRRVWAESWMGTFLTSSFNTLFLFGDARKNSMMLDTWAWQSSMGTILTSRTTEFIIKDKSLQWVRET